MGDKQAINGNDVLNILAAGGAAVFSVVIGGSMLSGFLQEPEKAETFLVTLGFGLVFGGLGCGIYAFHILSGRLFKFLYPIALALTILGYGLALVAQAMYKQFSTE